MPEIMTAPEVCEYLRIAKPTLYRYVRIGDIPGFKLGKDWRFRRESVDQWVKERAAADVMSRSKANKKSKAK